MRALIGMMVGLVAGYFVGYFIVISRIDESGGVLAKALVMNMAPTAPDTLWPPQSGESWG